jgi:hypothetical protein
VAAAGRHAGHEHGHEVDEDFNVAADDDLRAPHRHVYVLAAAGDHVNVHINVYVDVHDDSGTDHHDNDNHCATGHHHDDECSAAHDDDDVMCQAREWTRPLLSGRVRI